MGCNCGKGTQRRSYEVKFTNGTIKVYASEVEAKAAVARNGGGTIRAK
jgi:hypothetical protein